MNAILKDIEALGAHEKLQLAGDLWDRISEELVHPTTDAMKAALDRRAAWADANPGSATTLKEIAASVGVSL